MTNNNYLVNFTITYSPPRIKRTNSAFIAYFPGALVRLGIFLFLSTRGYPRVLFSRIKPILVGKDFKAK